MLLAVLNDVLFYAFDASSASTLIICVDSRVLVSARLTPLRSIDRLRAAVRRGETFRSPVELLAHLLRDQAEVLVQIVRDTTTEVDGIEDKLLARRSRPDVEAGFAATYAGAPAAAARAGAGRAVPAPQPPAGVDRPGRCPRPATVGRGARRRRRRLGGAGRARAAPPGRARRAVNEQTSRTLFVLTIVTVLALPMTIIPGFFGMNVGGVPFGANPHGFWAVVALVAGVAGAGAVWAFTRRGR